MAWKHINIDLEANNLLAPMLDYSSMPYKLKDTARLWCVSVRCVDTEQSVLLVPKDLLDFQAPVKAIAYSSVEPELETFLDEDGVEVTNRTGNNIVVLKYTEYFNTDGSLHEVVYEKTYNESLKHTYQPVVRELTEGVKYNLIPKRELSYDMLNRIFANAE